ncbi:MAG: hypothetical protein HYZ37_06815 [Candidatus Solibacter usitatus]|nr:hypothetical protein [Candidatus Solibacter usitatus]
MKSFRRIVAPALILVSAVSALAGLNEWLRFLDGASRAQSALFRQVDLPAGPVIVRRPAKEARTELGTLIQAAPSDADLYALRAREAELLLDFSAAESDWKKHCELAIDKFAGYVALADYYHRRVQVNEELRALAAAAEQASPAPERFIAVSEQRSWRTYERMLRLCQRQLLPSASTRDTFQKWSARYPRETAPRKQWIAFETANKQYARATQLLADYAKSFPADAEYPVTARVNMERAQGNAVRAAAIFNNAYQPLWPKPLVQSYFEFLRETRGLSLFLNAARVAAAANPMAIDPVARQFHYYTEEGNAAAAQRVLSDYRRRKERANAWNAAELRTMAHLQGSYAADRHEAARYYYALYSLPGATAADQEEALAGIVLLLFASDQAVPIGNGDLSFYRDIATADPYPGLLNGILSLLLNSSDPAYRMSAQEQNAAPYFQRAKAAALVDLFIRRFPQSPRRAGLQWRLIEACGIHGESDTVLSSGRKFLTDFPAHSARTNVMLLMAAAHARKGETQPELDAYDALLAELGKQADGVPMGNGMLAGAKNAGPRSADYARVLDRYVARLAALNRVKDGLSVLRREIDRNPNDPGLYERLATFLDQNKLTAEIESVYRRAMQQFPDTSWSHKLARLYLRQKQQAAFQKLTVEVAAVFQGTDLDRYIREVTPSGSTSDALYRQVNVAALRRFPNHLVFVNNLLSVYQRRGTADPAAYESLLRRYWFYDENLRARFFGHLSSTGKLRVETAALAKIANPAAKLMAAEADVWQSHFEAASPTLTALSKETPGDEETGSRAATLLRSLAAFDARKAGDALTLEASLVQAAPRQTAARIRSGEISRDYPRATAGRDAWTRIPEIEPGTAAGYLEAATAHWDYFEYDSALRLFDLGRRRLRDDALFAYEVGAVQENKRDYAKAIDEYVRGALARPGGSDAQTRLLQLARRPAYRQSIDAATAKLSAGANPSMAALSLRIALLEAQQDKAGLAAFLMNLAATGPTFELITRVIAEAQRLEMAQVEERARLREIELTPDALDKARLRLALARFHEDHRNGAEAARIIEALWRENPNTLGIVRAAVNYYARNNNETRAVAILTAVAPSAHPTLRPKLEIEAARRATSTGQTATARALLSRLLEAEPYNAAYLSAMADTFARTRDDAGLRAFYQDKIALISKAELPAADRLERVAVLRRSLIPVLVRAGDASSAIDQYIELLNRYPEDAALADEASAAAQRHAQQQRLTGHYEKAASASPRDFRFPLLLARITTALEEYPAAITWYAKASEIRPDRWDLLAARGDMEERLLRFDEAAATFTKVYDLTYQASSWMERVAEIRARQGREAECVTALEKAFLQTQAESPQGQFRIAERLLGWNMLPRAQRYAERGATLAGAKLMDEFSDGARTYARVMTRVGRYRDAHAKAPGGELLPAMAEIVGSHYDAARKKEFETFLTSLGDVAAPELGRLAGLRAWEAKRLAAVLETGEVAQLLLQALQQNRLRFAEYGAQLEAYAKTRAEPEVRNNILANAAKAYRSAGDDAGELRVLAQGNSGSQRYLQLLAARQPNTLVALASRRDRDDAANAAVASDNGTLAMSVITNRTALMPPVWSRAYRGLLGLYFGLRTPEIDAAFRAALGPQIAGERVGKPFDRRQQLSGGDWYYYGSRYGEYLDFLRKPGAEDYLAATVEASPGRAGAYVQLADYYRDSNRADQAVENYDYALQLDERNVGAIDQIARIHWSRNQRDAAVSRWNQALTAAAAQLQQRRVPHELPWQTIRVIQQLNSRQLMETARPAIDAAFAAYGDRWGWDHLRELVQVLGIPWGISSSRAMADPGFLLTSMMEADDIAETAKEPVLARLIEVSASRMAAAVGDVRSSAESEYWRWQSRLLAHLLDTKQTTRARTFLASLDATGRSRLSNERTAAELRVAAQDGTLAAKLDAWRADPNSVTESNTIIREAAMKLDETGDKASSRLILRYYYERELRTSKTAASNYLGLAETLLAGGDTNGAMTQLKRMALLSQPAFVNLKDAGLLLQRFQKNAEAAGFLNDAAKAIPWDKPAEQAVIPAGRTLAQLEAYVAEYPNDKDAKFALFRGARTAGRHALAVNAMQSLADGVGVIFEFDYGGGASQYLVDSFLQGQDLSRQTRAALARYLSDSLRRTGRMAGALAAREIARALDASAQDRAVIATLRAEMERLKSNAARRPLISQELKQDRLVRPMIAAAGGAQ